jgi:putative transposase
MLDPCLVTRALLQGGFVYHAINRAVARLPLFQKQGDYAAFERVLAEAMDKHPIRLVGYCLMPNHWHLVLWPQRDGQMTAFLRWLTHTHTQRWHAHYHSAGTGHVYQGRFRAFPIEEDDHLLTVLRYVERNPLRAGLVTQAQAWPWSSLGRLHRRGSGVALALHPGPVVRPEDWLRRVNRPETQAELEALRRSLTRGQPYGSEGWQEKVAVRLGLQYTFRPQGRPRKQASPGT